MAVMEIAIEPIGTDDPHMGALVTRCVDVIRNSGLPFRVGAMSTVVQGGVDELLEIAGKMLRAARAEHVPRVLATIRIDESTAAEHSLDDRARIVERGLSEGA